MRAKRAGAVAFDGRLLAEDIARRGWLMKDLAKRAGVSRMAVTRFLRGDSQTPTMAKKFSRAVGYSIDRYLIRSRRDAA